MAVQSEIFGLGSTRIPVGLSTIVRVSPTSYQYAETVKILSGSGTLEIVPAPLALSGTSTIGWGIGYPIGTNEIINIGGPAAFYLAATGSTMVMTMLLGYTSGVSLL